MDGKHTLYLDPKIIAKISHLELRARNVVEGFLTGLHKSPFKGFSVEFADYRQYMEGDDISHIDWKVFARTDKYYVKEFEDETNLKCYFLLDVSSSMGFKSKQEYRTKKDYAFFLASSLAYLMVTQRDNVGLVCFDEDIKTYLPAKGRVTHLRRFYLDLEKTKIGKNTNLEKPLHKVAELIKRRGLIILISDLWGDINELARGLKHFIFDGHEVIVLHILDPTEVNFPFEGITRFVDLETKKEVSLDTRMFKEKYMLKVKDYLNNIKIECNKMNVDYKLMTTETPVEQALFSYLAKRKELM